MSGQSLPLDPPAHPAAFRPYDPAEIADAAVQLREHIESSQFTRGWWSTYRLAQPEQVSPDGPPGEAELVAVVLCFDRRYVGVHLYVIAAEKFCLNAIDDSFRQVEAH